MDQSIAAPAPAAEAAARSEATAPLPEFERTALADLQRDLYEAHKLCFTMTGVGVVGGRGRCIPGGMPWARRNALGQAECLGKPSLWIFFAGPWY